DVGDLGKRLELELKAVRQCGVARRQRNDERVGERILRQAGDHFAQASGAAEIRQRSFPRNEARRAHAERSLALRFDSRDLAARRVSREEDRELRLERYLVRHGCEVGEQTVQAERQRQRDSDRQDVQDCRERGFGQTRRGLREAEAMVLDPRSHWSLPGARIKAGLRYLPISCWSCVATSTVTPTWLKAVNISMISSA